MSSLAERFVQLLISWRWPLLGTALAVAAVCYGPAAGVTFDRSIENMFAADDPLLEPYRKLQRVFGGNEIAVAVYVDPQLFEADLSGWRRLSDVSERCAKVRGVRAVLSIDRPLGELIVRDNQLAQGTRELFENYTHGADQKTVAVVCMLDPEEVAPAPREQTIEQLWGIVRDLPGGVLAGEPVMVVDGFRHLEQDGFRLSVWSTLLLSLTIVLCFRSLRWLVIPVAVVLLTVLSTRALLVVSGFRLSMVSSMLTAIIMVVAVATVVHIIVRFREGQALGLQPRDALGRAGRLLAGPIVWACATDAVGFAALVFSRVGPVQDFGVMMSIGALLVPLSVALLVPALALLGGSGRAPRVAWDEARLAAGLSRINRWVRSRGALVAALTAVLLVVSVTGILRLEVETDFTRNFRAESSVVQSYRFVERHLGGAGVWDVILPAPQQLDWSYLERVQQLEARLRREVVVPGADEAAAPGLTKVLSLSDAVIATSPFDLEQMPLLRETIVRSAVAEMRRSMPVFVAALHGADPQAPQRSYFRIMLRARERQAARQKQDLIEQVTRISREAFPPAEDQPGAEVTGFFVLLASLISSLIRDQWLTFAVATLGIAAMLIVAFRSLRYAAVALVPNALPILLVLGAMGWLGIRINMGAAMIAAVSMGLSVDSSIHYITSFRRLRRDGRSLDEALSEVQQTVGRAVVLSTLALMVGFSVLCASEFVPTIYFGMLVSLSMLGGLFGNLVLLPLLLRGVGSWPVRGAGL